MEPDRLDVALTLLAPNEIIRHANSFGWHADRFRRRNRCEAARWHEHLAEIVGSELLVRNGRACRIAAPLSQLRRITNELPERDRCTLTIRYEMALFDAEARAIRAPTQLILVIADELRRSLNGHPTAASRDIVRLP